MANYERIPNEEQEDDTTLETKPSAAIAAAAAVEKIGGAPPHGVSIGWPVNGMPVGDPAARRSEWETGLFSCLGRSDEFYSSDLEVCLLGSFAPCVLHASNVERLGSAPGTFANHCLPYTGLYLLGNCLFGWNCFAPWLSYPNRTAIRHKFDLQGCCGPEPVSPPWGGCCGSHTADKIRHEQCEASCDLCTHVLCHACALCQEAREVRRRLPHPGIAMRAVIVPPGGQLMSRVP